MHLKTTQSRVRWANAAAAAAADVWPIPAELMIRSASTTTTQLCYETQRLAGWEKLLVRKTDSVIFN